MAHHRTKPSDAISEDPRFQFPFDVPTWERIVQSLKLSPQQARIVECLLRGMSDKQISQDIGIRVPTIRTHLTRVFQHLSIVDRVQLVLLVFAESRAIECS